MAEANRRVVLTGALIDGFSREAVVEALAPWFGTTTERMAAVFEGGEHPIDKLYDAREASALQQQLERFGAVARIELVPPAGAGELDIGTVAESAPSIAPTRQAAREASPKVDTAPHDIHSATRTGLHDDWVDQHDEPPTEKYHVNLFMGMYATELTDACARMMLGPRTRPMLSWTMGAVISPFLWAMYRKMYAWGVVIFFAEILLPAVLMMLGSRPGIPGAFFYLGLALIVLNRMFWPAVLKYLYCRHARRVISFMHRMSPNYAPDIDIAARGGTSRTSVLVGFIVALVMCLFVWSVVDAIYDRVVAPGLRFTEPADLTLPGEVPPPVPATPSVSVQDQQLVDENRWVATRSKLRQLGLEIDTWLDGGGRSVDLSHLTLQDLQKAVPLAAADTVDGWGRRISFRSDGQVYKLTSAGPDGEYGTTDDVEYRRTRRH